MALKFIPKSAPRVGDMTVVDSNDPRGEPDLDHVERMVFDVAKVDAVAGLRDLIVQQQRRIIKLQQHERTLPYTLPNLTSEMNVLKAMLNDVVRFQTDRSVIEYLRQTATDPGHLETLEDITLEFENQSQLARATQRALTLLGDVE